MKKLFVSGIAFAALIVGPATAADIEAKPVYRAPPPPPFSWTGFYIGAHVGSGWATIDQRGVATLVGFPTFLQPSPSQTANGFLGGGQAGFNYQINQWVFGFEAQFSGTGLKTASACGNGVTAISFNICDVKIEWLGTIAGRVGWTVDHVLVYVTGGGAVAHNRHDYHFLTGALTLIPLDSFNDTRWGWMWGAGVEYALTSNWSAKFEYDYLYFGTKTYALPRLDALVAAQISQPNRQEISQHVHMIKFGVNYRFAWWGAGGN